jgi:putative transposase
MRCDEMSPQEWYTARELAGLALPGLPGSERGIQMLAKREGWPHRPRAGRGGGREYPLSALPKEAQTALFDRAIAQLPSTGCPLAAAVEPAPVPALREEAAPPAVIEVPDLGDLKTWQTRTMDARLAFIRLLERASVTVGLTKAVATLARKSREGDLPPELQRLVETANARAGKNGARALSERSLMRWWSDYKKAGGNYAALAPAAVEKSVIPPWAPAFLLQYQTPQKISIADALRKMKQAAPAGLPIPSEDQVRRWLKKYSRLDVQRGRKSGSELRGQRLYRQRDTSEFQPLDIVSCDGHSFKAYVAHPVHGRPFHPEVCACLDAVTRCVIGWSAGLAESALTVADALRHACTVDESKPVGGLPIVFYTDNGGGNTAQVNADEIAGLFSRLSITFETGRPGNPQGRGMIERLNATLWIPAAKRLPTFTGKGMDSLAKRGVYLQLQKEVRQSEKEGVPVNSQLLISWADFLLFLQEEVDAYNRRPHRSLPRITDPQTGLRRHMTPLEAWAGWLQRGWRPELLTAEEVDHLFRPHQSVTCSRGIVRLFKQVYADPALEHYHGMQLMVGYDIHDPSRVWVRGEDGRLIVIAKRDANKSAFFPVSRMEQLREERFKGRKKRVETRLEEIELERRGGPIELRPVPERIELPAEVLERSEKIIARIEQKKKLFGSPWERYGDLRARLGQADPTVTDYERRWYADYEIYTATRKRVGLFAADEFCLGEQAQRDAK